TPKVVEQLPKQSPTKTLVKPTSNPSPKLQPIRISKAGGDCECPYDTDKRGRSCGARSAYTRKGGRSGALCYTND
ncbi:MAG: SH3 domain-containing protein, partial [Coleofasciculaceae cyanobacterium]